MSTVVGRAPRRSSSSRPHPYRRLIGHGLLATLVAMVAVVAAAAIARALGVVFEIPEGGEKIPLPGFASVTFMFSMVGLAIAAALLRWSARPAQRFVRTAIALTAVSFVPPVLSGARPATVIALIVLHLVVASVMIPTLARLLR